MLNGATLVEVWIKIALPMVEKVWRFGKLSSLRRATLVGAPFLLFAIADVSAVEPRRVLLVHAFGHAYSPWSDMAGSFRAELVKDQGTDRSM